MMARCRWLRSWPATTTGTSPSLWETYGARGWHVSGKEYGALFTKPSSESTFHATNSNTSSWCAYFNQTDLDRLYELYRMDYVAFGYSRPRMPQECGPLRA